MDCAANKQLQNLVRTLNKCWNALMHLEERSNRDITNVIVRQCGLTMEFLVQI